MPHLITVKPTRRAPRWSCTLDEVDKAATCSVRAATCSHRSCTSSGLFIRIATGSESIVMNNFARVIAAFKVVTSPEALYCLEMASGIPTKNWCSKNGSLAACSKSVRAWVSNFLSSCTYSEIASPGQCLLWWNSSNETKFIGIMGFLINFSASS